MNLTCEMQIFCLCCCSCEVRTPRGPRERPPVPDEPRLGSGHCCHLHMRRGLRAVRVSCCQHSGKKLFTSVSRTISNMTTGKSINSLSDVFALLRCYTAQVGSWLPTFRVSFLVFVRLYPWRWDLQAVPKCRQSTTNLGHVLVTSHVIDSGSPRKLGMFGC